MHFVFLGKQPNRLPTPLATITSSISRLAAMADSERYNIQALREQIIGAPSEP